MFHATLTSLESDRKCGGVIFVFLNNVQWFNGSGQKGVIIFVTIFFFFPFHPFALCVYSGGVHHCYHALRGPLCFADPRHNSARVHERHQGLPPHRLQAAQQSRGQGRCTSVSTHPWVLERFRRVHCVIT